MADESNDGEGNEDSWLYGNSDPKPPGEEEESEEKTPGEEESNNEEINDEKVNNTEGDDDEADGNVDDPTRAADEMEEQDLQEDDENANRENGDIDSDDSEDDINVVIGDIKSGPNYNIKQRGTLVAPAAPTQDKPKQPAGKFSIEEFESVGTINGMQTHEFSIDSLDEKPWRKPGADITDYFNYGFNEDTWRSYCERQKRMRVNESGVGLAGLAVGMNAAVALNAATTNNNRTLTTLANDHNKYGATPGVPTKENVIQVMTADRREYSRPTGKFDPNVPPPFGETEGYFDEPDPYYNFEPTQEWANNMPMNTGWQPSGIKELTPGPQMLQQPMNMQPQMGGPMRPPMGQMPPHMVGPPIHMGMNPPRFIPPMHGGPDQRDRDRDRDRDRHDRDRHDHRDRDRDRNDRERNDRERNDRERNDRERNDRERNDRERNDRERNDRERIDRERNDRERMDRERGERDRMERDRNDNRLDRDRERGDRDRDRMRDREHKSTESEKPGRETDSPNTLRERDRERSNRVKPDRYRDERGRRERERSRSREKSRRPRSRSRDKERDKEREKEREKDRDRNRDKKKPSVKKEKEESE